MISTCNFRLSLLNIIINRLPKTIRKNAQNRQSMRRSHGQKRHALVRRNLIMYVGCIGMFEVNVLNILMAMKITLNFCLGV